MIGKSTAACAAFLILLLSLFAPCVKAQPILPDLAGITRNGVNILTWTCQYDGIKSIAVTRSSDSLHNYTNIGYVKNVKKGVQVFADGHPLPGKNWYQLEIVFNSDLNWNSNKIKMYIDSSIIINQKVVLPPNDSLQKFIVSSADKTKEPLASSSVQKRTGKNIKSKIVVTMGGTDSGVITSINPTQQAAVALNDSMQKKMPKLTISINQDVDINPYSYIKSEYIFTDPVSGHVSMNVPNVKRFRYSIRFFNEKNKMVIEVPRINESPIIIDKRNFQQKGLYKFVLKKDNKEFETGFVTIY